MAITKMNVYRNPPEDITDYEAMVEKLDMYARMVGGAGMILTEWTNASEWPKLAMGSYIFHGGASYLVDTEDYEIGAPGNGTHYLRIAASGETLAVSWISSLTGYAWNPIYNGLYHADQSQILPYLLVGAGASRETWKITNLAQGGGFITANWEGRVRAGGIDTGQGVNKLYPMDQAVRTTDDPVFGWRTADDIITLDDVRLRYNNMGAGGVSNLYGTSLISGRTSSTSYVQISSFKVSDVLSRVAQDNGITGARIMFSMGNEAGGTSGKGGYKITVNGTTVKEGTYSESIGSVTYDMALGAHDTIAIWLRFISGGDGVSITTAAPRGIKFSRELTFVEQMFQG